MILKPIFLLLVETTKTCEMTKYFQILFKMRMFFSQMTKLFTFQTANTGRIESFHLNKIMITTANNLVAIS